MKIYVNTLDMKKKNLDVDMNISKWGSLASIYSSNPDKYVYLSNNLHNINSRSDIKKVKYIKFGKIIYKLYIKSALWRKKRMNFINNVCNTCESCNIKFPTKELCLHHNTYERLWKELDSDLNVVCTNCHHNIHFEDGKKMPLDPVTLNNRFEKIRDKFSLLINN